MQQQDEYVYRLRDPRAKTDFYVGITTDVAKRLKFHMRDARQGCGTSVALRTRLIELEQAGLEPDIEVLEAIRSVQQQNGTARDREHYWIEELTRQGAHLLNVEGLTRAYGKQQDTAHLVQFQNLKQYGLRARLSIARPARKAQVDETTVRRAETRQELSIDDLGITIYR